ncbi:hypothetical protein JTB14_011680 [Gonioctena quinquepunctata]|nr:hypothetical protein JTB14_011680 [Gonioctena quinquepunctata]
MLGPFWKTHFALAQFYPICEDPGIFVACQWQKDKTRPNFRYLSYRTTIALLFLITWIISIVRESGDGRWPIFLTNWGYTLCTTQALLAVFMLLLCIMAEKCQNMAHLRRKALRVYPVYWILNTMSTSTAFGITVIYWLVIYDAETMEFNAMNYFVHGNNSILMMLDLWMVAHPVRILHFLYTGLFAIAYMFFSVIYFVAGGTNRDGTRCIYKIVDWDKPLGTSLTCLGVMLFIIFLHMVTVMVSSLRRTLNEKCGRKEQDISPMPETKKHATYVNEGMTTDIV